MVLGPMHTIYHKKALKIIGGIRILSALVATPTFFDYSVHPEPMTSQDVGSTTAVTPYMLCKPKYDVFDKVNGFFILSSSYMIPHARILNRYYRLLRFIVRQGHQTTGGLTSSFVSHNRTRIIKMLIIIAVLFSFAWLPYYILFVDAVIFLYLLLSSFYTGFMLAHDSCVMTKVNVSKHCTRTMKISDIINLVLVHVISTWCSYTSSATFGARTRHQQHSIYN